MFKGIYFPSFTDKTEFYFFFLLNNAGNKLFTIKLSIKCLVSSTLILNSISKFHDKNAWNFFSVSSLNFIIKKISLGTLSLSNLIIWVYFDLQIWNIIKENFNFISKTVLCKTYAFKSSYSVKIKCYCKIRIKIAKPQNHIIIAKSNERRLRGRWNKLFVCKY